LSVVFDSTTLMLALDPSAKSPFDTGTDKAVERASERVEHLIETLDANGEQIIIPTPVLAEVLVHAGAAAAGWLNIFNTRSVFRVAPFDEIAAIEVAAMFQDMIRRGGLKIDAVTENVSRSKVKFDRQIVAIAKVQGASIIYSDDGDVRQYGKRSGIEVVQTAELPLPPEDPQTAMDL
jgi:predicted nucleic acid-binding protein